MSPALLETLFLCRKLYREPLRTNGHALRQVGNKSLDSRGASTFNCMEIHRTATRGRLKRILRRFSQVYPDAHCELVHANPLQLLVATILSAQCSDQQVNRVTPALFERYRTAQDFADAELGELERAIQRVGLYRSKARNIQRCCRKLAAAHQGKVPATMAELLELDGVGRKTANVVLGNAFGRADGIVVDTHVARLSHRLGFTRATHPEKIERDLQDLVPKKDWTVFSHWLIWHGRRRCTARNPDCAHCEINRLCPSARCLPQIKASA